MSGAVLISWIIVALCLLQSAVFLAVARFDSLNRAALWFSGAFLAAALSFGGEIVLSAGWWPGPVRMTIALAMVVMLVLLAYGLGRHYHVPLPAGGGFAIIAASALLYWLILDLPRADFLRQMLYQLPYALLSLFGLSVIARAREKAWFDRVLLVLFGLLAIHFVLKPFLAQWVGGVGTSPGSFAQTSYAGLSTALGAVLLLVLAACGLVLVLGDTAKRLIRRAERDAETGLLNRAGFTAHARRMVVALAETESPDLPERVDMALTLIAVDHPVIPATQALAATDIAARITALAPAGALVGRVADYDFAILAPQANLFAARDVAEALRTALATDFADIGRPVALSIGITEREPGDVYADLLARGLWALDEAQRAGGDCLRLAARSEFALPNERP